MTEFGEFRLHGFKDARTGLEHAALHMGPVESSVPVLTRVHSECVTGDAFHSLHCDCGKQLRLALETVAARGHGVLLYLRQEGRGIGLVNKIRAYALQQTGADTVDANRLLGLPDDARDYAVAAEMLGLMGISRVLLMTNNPAKVDGLRAHGIEVVERVPLEAPRTPENGAYLDTKAERMGHMLSAGGLDPAASAEVGDTGSVTSGAASARGTVCLSRRD